MTTDGLSVDRDSLDVPHAAAAQGVDQDTCESSLPTFSSAPCTTDELTTMQADVYAHQHLSSRAPSFGLDPACLKHTFPEESALTSIVIAPSTAGPAFRHL